jgi:hypothetical protein
MPSNIVNLYLNFKPAVRGCGGSEATEGVKVLFFTNKIPVHMPTVDRSEEF